MAVDRTYRCDLCRDMAKPENLYGIYWTSHTTLEMRPARTTEHHLCSNCITQISLLKKAIDAKNLQVKTTI